MKNAILHALGKSSVQSVTSAFQKTITQLGEVENRHLDAVARRQDQIDDLELKNDESRIEARRSSVLASKLSKLFDAGV